MNYKQIDSVDSLNGVSKPYIVLFISSPTCRPCKQIEPSFNNWAGSYGKYAEFFKANIETVETIADKYDVTKVPTFLILKADGTFINKILGNAGETMIKNVLDATFIKIRITDDF